MIADRILTGLFPEISLLILLCFCLPGFTLAQQDGFPPSENGQLFAPEQEKAPEEGQSAARGEERPGRSKGELTRSQKTVLLNAVALAAVLGYGAANWDYGESSFHFNNEGWFERDTLYGGADKLGHFWASYTLSHIYSYLYRKWGYTDGEANLYGAISNLGFQTFMEVADGFSPTQGFSYEDMIMNVAGAGAAYVWGKYPSLARKIDFRMEYTPEFNKDDFGFADNYERQRFLIAVKADGFDFIKNSYLQYLEFHLGYYARGYEEHEEGGPDDRRRNIFVGIGFNVSKLVQKKIKTSVFNYIQIPYTSVDKTIASD